MTLILQKAFLGCHFECKKRFILGTSSGHLHHDSEATGFEDVKDYQYSYQVIQDKSLADSVEALIGAFFQSTGVEGCLAFMNDVLRIPSMFKEVLQDQGIAGELAYLISR